MYWCPKRSDRLMVWLDVTRLERRSYRQSMMLSAVDQVAPHSTRMSASLVWVMEYWKFDGYGGAGRPRHQMMLRLRSMGLTDGSPTLSSLTAVKRCWLKTQSLGDLAYVPGKT